MTSPSSQFLCFGHETTHSLGLRPVLGLLLYIFRSFSNVSCWASPPIRVLLKWAARGQVDSVARLCPSQARKLPPPTHGLRANSGFRASLDRLLIKGKPTPVLGLCNLSFLSFILIQEPVFIYLFSFLRLLSVGEGKAPLLFTCNQRKAWVQKWIFKQGKSLCLSGLVKTANFELRAF